MANHMADRAGSLTETKTAMRPTLLLFLRANRRHLVELLLASVLINAMMLAMPLFSMLVYDKAVGNQVHDTLWALAIGMAVMLGLELLMRGARVMLVEHAGARWDTFLDERLMRGVLGAPLSRDLQPADILTRVRQLGATRDALSAQSLLAFADIPFVLLFATVLGLIGGWLVCIPLAIGAFVLLAGYGLQQLAERRHRDADRATRGKIGLLLDVLAARESLVGRAQAGSAEAAYRTLSQAGARAAAGARWWQQLNGQLAPVLISVCSVMVLVAGVYQVEALALSVGGLISVNMIAIRLVSTLCTVAPLVSRWKEFTRALAGLSQAVDMHAAPLAPAQLPGAALGSEGVRLEGLGLRYPRQVKPVLDQLTLDFKPGQIVALVGASGAGKTTLLRVLAGQLPHTEGQLAFGGHVVASDADRQWMGRQVQHKPQDPCFLGGSLSEVVSSGAADADPDAVIAALRHAGLGPALDRGELGLNSRVGANGAGLSGGQRQSLALATAFHGELPVVLLDEPTLGLDRTAQERVLDSLATLREGRCVIVATHAADVIKRADRMLVLDRGRLVADGPPDRLLASAVPAHREPAARPADPKAPREQTATAIVGVAA
jgi:ATP-binding cassette subfamily B protein/ATP-binding cassette subfamily C protein LapB